MAGAIAVLWVAYLFGVLATVVAAVGLPAAFYAYRELARHTELTKRHRLLITGGVPSGSRPASSSLAWLSIGGPVYLPSMRKAQRVVDAQLASTANLAFCGEARCFWQVLPSTLPVLTGRSENARFLDGGGGARDEWSTLPAVCFGAAPDTEGQGCLTRQTKRMKSVQFPL